MVDNQAKKISGYRDLSQGEIDLINEIKAKEADLAGLYKQLQGRTPLDLRWMALAKTLLQLGFMALTRAVGKPKDVWE